MPLNESGGPTKTEKSFEQFARKAAVSFFLSYVSLCLWRHEALHKSGFDGKTDCARFFFLAAFGERKIKEGKKNGDGEKDEEIPSMSMVHEPRSHPHRLPTSPLRPTVFLSPLRNPRRGRRRA